MNQEYTFKFSDLSINPKEIALLFGYYEDSFSELFESSIHLAMSFADKLPDIKGAYCIIDNLQINQRNFRIQADGRQFDVGKAVCKELKGAERAVFYVCTAGKTISEESSRLLYGEDPILGYILDTLGSMITEAACDLLQSFLKKELESTNDQLTNRYSPGYCQWPIADQHKLFSFFPENVCEISLSDSALMSPMKSVSGIIGIGEKVKFRKYVCILCSSKDCIYRKIRIEKQSSQDKISHNVRSNCNK